MNDTLTFRTATSDDREAIVAFMRRHWGAPHPLIELPEFFSYYYEVIETETVAGQSPTGASAAISPCLATNTSKTPPEHSLLRFGLCYSGDRLAAIAGYIPASHAPQPDVWVSLWVADPAVRGAGLALMDALPQLCGCRTLACNNIRPETRPFYEFLGYTTGRVGHFYRLNTALAGANGQGLRIARFAPADENSAHPIDKTPYLQMPPPTPPACGPAALHLLPTPQALAASGFVPLPGANPCKDFWYISRRYFSFPRQAYQLYAATLPGQPNPFALLACRLTQVPLATTVPGMASGQAASAISGGKSGSMQGGAAALRIVDYIGPAGLFPALGPGIDALIQETGTEYADLYCAGLDEALLRQAGFVPRPEDAPFIVPTYLEPPLYQNIEYYYFTNNPVGFTLFKADGDQDRPNVELPPSATS